MSPILSELNDAMPSGYKVTYSAATHSYVVVDKRNLREVFRRKAKVVQVWREGRRGAVMASALRYELTKKERKAS